MLDGYFKSYFFTFVLAALFFGSCVSAKITNIFVADALQPSVADLYLTGGGGRVKAKVDDKVAAAPTDAFLARNLFGAEIVEPEPIVDPSDVVEEEAKPEEIFAGACDPTRCQPSSVPANLLMTLWSTDSDESAAIFQATAGGTIFRVGPGDKLLDQATVTAVYRNNVCVSRNGSCELFSLSQANKSVTAAVAKPAAPAPKDDGPALGDGVRKVNDKAYEIPKQEIDNVLSNLNQIARQARIVPSFKDGKSNGFKLFSIRPNSLYSKIGIQNGDIVQKINGFEMNSPDKALQIYSKLKDASSITVDLVRRGKPVTMSYSIR